MTPLSPNAPRRISTPSARVRADEAVINQWLRDQTTPARRVSASPARRPARRLGAARAGLTRP
ncbi:hypothetical protein DVA67_017955 [Solirubrobacter sp. CPCC 204708]|uniref:Uncharacterized protein n=1 Tax=Solirubrobacter deserti TaxID=2282478 RepID=A0ABT4RCV1_9ACTN|nr:hypothetical protein [Solirubrobacter deserti]MBE2317871.1 hypothetical protein [Solirubrobacter deserti]MDA0136352.1 hypothetical protein [Solirubrobacter deserti]